MYYYYDVSYALHYFSSGFYRRFQTIALRRRTAPSLRIYTVGRFSSLGLQLARLPSVHPDVACVSYMGNSSTSPPSLINCGKWLLDWDLRTCIGTVPLVLGADAFNEDRASSLYPLSVVPQGARFNSVTFPAPPFGDTANISETNLPTFPVENQWQSTVAVDRLAVVVDVPFPTTLPVVMVVAPTQYLAMRGSYSK